MDQLRKKSLQGMVWSFTQQFSGQILSFLISIVLARILLPAEFGLIGMIAVIIAIGGALKDAGMSQSLIRTENPVDLDYSTVFFINLLASAIIYVIIFLSAPFVSEFYGEPILIDLIRVLSLGIVVGAFSSVQRTKLTKELNFKTQFFVEMPSLIASGSTGIIMAYNDFGVWSIVAMQLVRNTLSTIQLWIHSRWVPKRVFSLERFKHHLNFGYKLTLSSMIDVLYNNLFNVIIGKYFTSSDLGYYTRAESTENLVVQNITGAVHKVTFPLFSEIQNDNARLKKVYKMVIQQVLFWIAPILVGAAVIAEPLFRFVFTEKWLPAVPMFQILCAVGIMYPIHGYNLAILNVKGRSDLFLKLEIIKKVIAVSCVFIVLPYGIFALLYFQVAFSVFVFFLNTYYSKKFINYSMFEQIKHISPILIVALVMGAVCYILDQQLIHFELSDFLRILIGAIAGLISYFLLAMMLKLDPYMEFLKIIRKKG